MGKGNVLIIEDDRDIREGVRILLESEGYIVTEAESGEKGLGLLSDDTDLVILDVMMPGISGFRTCQEIRKQSFVPVIFLTAKTDETDKLAGLMMGGDDYVSKPFSYVELLGRVKALLRRYRVYSQEGGREKEKWIERAGIRVNEEFNEVNVRGEPKELSNIEYSILLLMMRHPGKIFSAANIYESVWNEPYYYTCSNTVMVHIRKLRAKIEEDPQNPVHIQTVWGKGYKFEAGNK